MLFGPRLRLQILMGFLHFLNSYYYSVKSTPTELSKGVSGGVLKSHCFRFDSALSCWSVSNAIVMHITGIFVYRL